MTAAPNPPVAGDHALRSSEIDPFKRESSQITFDIKDARRPSQDDLHAPQAVANSYARLERRISELDHQLGLFLAECRQLGRSYALILAARDLREGLESLLSMFYENATHLSPSLLETRSPSMNASGVSSEPFQFWLGALAKACDTFRERLNEFREYTDESAKVKTLMMTFSRDLMYRSSCLEGYRDALKTTYMRHYINDLADEMGKDLDNIASAFKFFNNYGMPAMQYEQRRDTDILIGVSTVSTFFSAVTATTLQTSLSIQQEENNLIYVVNSFWFCSMVLSIGAALNSLLAVIWKRTPYGSRGRRLPLWVTLWIHASAPAFLAISIASFSAGLALFAYSSGQKSHTKIVTLVTTAITSFGVIVVAAWFTYEQYVAPLLLPDAPWRPFGTRIHEWKASMSEKSTSRLALSEHRRYPTGSLSSYSSGSTHSGASSFNFLPQKLAARLPAEIRNKIPRLRHETEFEQNQSPLNLEEQPAPFSESSEAPGQARARWARSARLVTTLKTATRAFKQGTHSAMTSPVSANTTPNRTPATTAPFDSTFFLSMPKDPTWTLALPPGTIQDLEYSPNGLLAVTSYDDKSYLSTTTIYTVNMNHPLTTSYEHSAREATKRLSWRSSNKERLLIQLDHSVDFLDETCHLFSSVKRPNEVESAVWLSASTFLTVEKSTVFTLTTSGHVQAKHRFDNLLLRDVAVVPESHLLLVTGRFTHTRDEKVPSNSRAEKQFILYDLRTRQSLSRHPVLDDIRFIRISRSMSRARDGFDILLSHKNRPSPRLWTLQPQISGPHRLVPGTVSLHAAAELSGHVHFIGNEDQMMACVGLDGTIHIWDRETARHVYRVPARARGKGIRCFAWSPTSGTFASADDTTKELRLWSTLQSDEGHLPPDISEKPELHTEGARSSLSVLGGAVTFDEPVPLSD